MTRRKGRGRLSSIELLPADAQPLVAWAASELKRRERTQIDILADFNEQLGELARKTGIDIQPISSSAFNRHTIGLAMLGRRLEEMNVMSAALVGRLDLKSADDLTVLATETIKTLIVEMLESAGEAGFKPKEAMEMARALQAAVSARATSDRQRREMQDEFDAKAAKAIDTVAKQKGLTKETVADIKAQILGVTADA